MIDLDALLRIWARYKCNKERYGLNIVRGPITLYDKQTGETIDSCEWTLVGAMLLLSWYEIEVT